MSEFTPASSPSLAASAPPWLTDEFLKRYVCWREACQDVRAAYDNWRDVERADRQGAFFAYGAALDREESAARDYHEVTQRLALRAVEPARA